MELSKIVSIKLLSEFLEYAIDNDRVIGTIDSNGNETVGYYYGDSYEQIAKDYIEQIDKPKCDNCTCLCKNQEQLLRRE